MQGALAGAPVEAFPNVEPLEKLALTKEVKVDTPDNAPTEDSEQPSGTPPKPSSPITELPPGPGDAVTKNASSREVVPALRQ